MPPECGRNYDDTLLCCLDDGDIKQNHEKINNDFDDRHRLTIRCFRSNENVE